MKITTMLNLITLGAAKQAGQFSVMTGSEAFLAKLFRSLSLTYASGRITLRSPSLVLLCIVQVNFPSN